MGQTTELRAYLARQDELTEWLAANGELQEATALHGRFLDQMDAEIEHVCRLLWQVLRAGRLEEAKAAARAALIHYGRADEQEQLAREWAAVLARCAETVSEPFWGLMSETEVQRAGIQSARQAQTKKAAKVVALPRRPEPSPAA